MKDVSAIRSSYKAFLESLAGKDLIEHLLNIEMGAQADGVRSKAIEEKALAMERIGVSYNLRTYISDMSKPVPSQSVRSAGSK